MDFIIIAKLFEELEKTNKRIPKILLLRDFLEKYPKEGPLIFDIIAGNFQRKIGKKKLAISLKTIFEVIGFLSKKNRLEIEKDFNKVGDLGEITAKILEDTKQKSLNTQTLTFNRIKTSLIEITKISGTNSNKRKKEILTNLFLNTTKSIDNKFLARLLINDLRIGVSEGVLKEAMTNTYFPKIIDIHKVCPECSYINLNLKNCLKCNTDLNKTNQLELFKNKYEIVELDTPNNTTGLNKYVEYKLNPIEYALRRDKDKYILISKTPRDVYNKFLIAFEKKYNLLNSFVKVSKELNNDFTNINKFEIEIGIPIKSMLGTRAQTVKESFEMTSKPALLDFKYDGLRVQIHNNKGKVNLFTRNLDEITQQFPEVIDFIQTNFSDISFVADSECVGFDYKKGKFLPFQMLSKRILTKEITEVDHINVIVKVFDILYLNNKTLIDKSYKERREILEQLMLNRKLKQKLHFDVEKLRK